jgi:signal transduction histidine kinase
VEVAIEDTGRGVPPGDAERIFEPFVTTKQGGSGLGLAISRMIVEAHGGTLAYEPTSLGSRFRFTLPRHVPHALPEKPPAPEEPR